MPPDTVGFGQSPISDDELQRALIGPVTPHNGPITLVDYNPEWPVLYSREASASRARLRQRVRLRAGHGSGWLRVSDAGRAAYLRVKRELAKRTWRHVQHYADAKSAIVEEILARAAAAS